MLLAIHRHLFRFILSSVHGIKLGSHLEPVKQQNVGIAQKHENSMYVHKVFTCACAMKFSLKWDHLQSFDLVPPPTHT
jgi:hypothetical protein